MDLVYPMGGGTMNRRGFIAGTIGALAGMLGVKPRTEPESPVFYNITETIRYVPEWPYAEGQVARYDPKRGCWMVGDYGIELTT